MLDIQQMMRRQRVLADFGDLALRSEDLDEVLTEACRLVGAALGTDRSKILEIEGSGNELLVRAGVGWGPNVVGRVRLPMSERSSETYSIREGKPVISRDIGKEDRFDIPEFMRAAGVVAMVNVPIFVPGRRPYGLLQVDADEPREFGQEDIEFLRTYATILGPVIDRLRKVRRLRTSEERFRLIVETVTDYAIFTTDAHDRIDGWFAGAEAVFGWTADEAVGQPAGITSTPEDREAGVDRREVERARRDGSAPNVRWHLRKDGKRVFIEGAVRSLVDEAGAVQGFVKIGQDVTDRRRADEALHESEEQQRLMLQLVPAMLWCADPAGHFIAADQRWKAATGQGDAEVNDFGWLDALHPDDREGTRAAFAHAFATGEPLERQHRIHRIGDGYRWHLVRHVPVRDERGGILRWFGAAIDVQDLHELQKRQDVLVAEVQHRTRNLIAVVKGIANDTMRETGPTEAFRAAFADRLSALSRVQGLLSRSEAEPITIGSLLRLELDALGAGAAGDRVTAAGPEVFLRPSTVQTLALALHELATNARKHGALSHEHGRLSVTWRERSEAGESRLAIEWVETGLEQVQDRPASDRRDGGYGRELIEQALPHALGARTSYALSASGVRCTIDLAVRPGKGEP